MEGVKLPSTYQNSGASIKLFNLFNTGGDSVLAYVAYLHFPPSQQIQQCSLPIAISAAILTRKQ